MSQRDEWQHYNIHKQAFGEPINGTIVWYRRWQVRRPYNHPNMQGDDWERLGYKTFDTHQQAYWWAMWEASKDKLREELQRMVDTWA
jgi:hypothetical protein